MKNQLLIDSCNSFLSRLDTGRMMRNTRELYELELPQDFNAYHRSAARTLELLREAGLPNAEKITFPADGKTVFQDKTSPLGWTVTYGTLSVVKGSGLEKGLKLADYKRNSFELIKGSVGTAPGGKDVPVLTHRAVLAGADPAGALIIPPLDKGPVYDYLGNYLDRGALGFISDYAFNSEDEPDGVQWCNAYTEHNSWHVVADDRPFIAFSISPRMGRKLRRAADRGEVICHIDSDAQRCENTVDVVTACVPGRRKEEFWIMAHLYEPLANDNSSGVAAAIESARMIMEQGVPEFSLRVIFGLEYYGFAAYAEHRSHGSLRSAVIGGCDYDAMYLRNDWQLNFRCAPPGTPFYGNYISDMCCRSFAGLPGMPEMKFSNSFDCMYDDDTFLGDADVGVPVLWPIRTGDALWHNSKQTMDYIHADAFALGTAINSTVVDCCVNPKAEYFTEMGDAGCDLLKQELARAVGSHREHLIRRKDILCADALTLKRAGLDEAAVEAVRKITACCEELLPELSDEIPHSPWRDYAARITVSRKEHGLPYDLAKLPPEKRRPLPGGVIYGPLAAIISNMDGKRDLAAVIRMAEHESSTLLSEKEIKKLISAIFFLADSGYLDLNGFKGITKDDIVKSLRDIGVKEGDMLLVHSSLSPFGYISGGGETVIEALKEAVGPQGTFLLPGLIFCFANIGGPAGNELYRAYDKNDIDSIWTGALPRLFIEKYPEAVRSKHITHCWIGIGPLAEAALSGQGAYDPPAGETSPLDFALKHNGKILHFGNGIGSTTFLHYVEDRLDLPGLADTLCLVKGVDGIPFEVCVPRNLPGCRDFYWGNKDTIKVFKAAQERGLQIHSRQLELGELLLMDMKELFDVAVALAKEDPFILLHDEGKCHSCDYWRARYVQKEKMKSAGLL